MEVPASTYPRGDCTGVTTQWPDIRVRRLLGDRFLPPEPIDCGVKQIWERNWKFIKRDDNATPRLKAFVKNCVTYDVVVSKLSMTLALFFFRNTRTMFSLIQPPLSLIEGKVLRAESCVTFGNSLDRVVGRVVESSPAGIR